MAFLWILLICGIAYAAFHIFSVVFVRQFYRDILVLSGYRQFAFIIVFYKNLPHGLPTSCFQNLDILLRHRTLYRIRMRLP